MLGPLYTISFVVGVSIIGAMSIPVTAFGPLWQQHTHACCLLLFSIAFAVIVSICTVVYNNCCKGRRASRPVEKEEFTGDLAPTSLFSCFSMGCKPVMEAICCSVCVVAGNWERASSAEERSGFYGRLGSIFGVILLPMAVIYVVDDYVDAVSSTAVYYGALPGIIYLIWKDTSVRLQLAAKPPGVTSTSSCLPECLKSYFCSWCSIMQVAEFTELYADTFGDVADEDTALLSGKV